MAKKTDKKNTKASETEADGLLQRAFDGDRVALKRLKEMELVKKLGWENMLVSAFGDFGQQTEEEMIKAITHENLIHKESIAHCTKKLRAELAGPEPTPLESVLVDRIVCCWIQANHADMVYANQLKNSLTLKQMEYYQKTQDRATKRFLIACKTFAQVRKLLRPNIQVNIAEKQVNMMGQP